MRAALASSNAHKARELAALMPGWAIEPLDMRDAPDETGSTFLENARIKALHGRRLAPVDAWALGEDSGIEVDALGGAPGIRSARYAGEGATDEANLDALLAAVEGVEAGARSARYVCELVAIGPDGVELSARGELPGTLARERRGTGGFGYDPIFVPAGESRTVGELGDGWKRGRSHRAAAARALLEALAARPRTA